MDKKVNKDNQGFVYVLTNPSFKDDWVKIGKSSRPVDVRSKELDNTAVPLPFEIFATMQTAKYSEAEKLLHKNIDRLTDLRIRQNREFFNVAPELALELLLDVAKLLDDAVVCRYVGGEHTQIYPVISQPAVKRKTCQTEKRSNFRFSMIGIKVGESITFDPRGIKVKVADDQKIEYKDRLWSLTGFTAEHLPKDMQNASGAYQGPKYFSYNGKTLWALRLEAEKE